MNRFKEKTKIGLLFLMATAMLSFVPGFGMERVCAQTSVTLDIDGNGVVDAGTDALLISRYMHEFRGNALISGVVGQNCTRCTASAIEAYLTTLTAFSCDGDTFANGLGMTFRLIPAGSFTMGSPTDEPGREDDETEHQVTLTQAFYMQTTEVTQGQWKAVMKSNPSTYSECGENCPVETVSWNDVREFISKMNERGEGTYRLPTEAEWEYAARAGSTAAFANGGIAEIGCEHDPNLYAMGWYCGNSGVTYSGCHDASWYGGPSCAGTHPVAQKQANLWGLYDTHGSVYEWCQDWHGDYPTGPLTDPTGPGTGSSRVARGGCWGSSAKDCRSACRFMLMPEERGGGTGFRLAFSPSRK